MPTEKQQKHRVIVFGTPTCSWCRVVKKHLRDHKVSFRYIDVSKDQSAANDMVRKTGQSGVPVILIDNRPIVGFDKTKINKLLGLRD